MRMTELEIKQKYLVNGKYSPMKSEQVRQQRKDKLNQERIVDSRTLLQKVFAIQPYHYQNIAK